jgi:hypothetical protein
MRLPVNLFGAVTKGKRVLKCSSERCVCAPQSLPAGTLTSPRLSMSLQMSLTMSPTSPEQPLFSDACEMARVGRRPQVLQNH